VEFRRSLLFKLLDDSGKDGKGLFIPVLHLLEPFLTSDENTSDLPKRVEITMLSLEKLVM
jgi:hypothetical protein